MIRAGGGDAAASAALGLAAAVASYVVWGLSPLFWKLLSQVDALDTLAHRYFWALPFTFLGMVLAGNWARLRSALARPRVLAMLALSGTTVSVNSGIYIWAVNHDRVVEASFGYYLSPLLTVLIGLVLFRERLRRWQWVAIGLAALGVATQGLMLGDLPLVGLGVAGSFAFYGALRKHVDVGPLTGYFLEICMLAPAALAYLLWLGWHDAGAFGAIAPATDALLVAGGLITAVPFLLYVTGARRLPLATLGIFFYINPTLQFAIGALVFDEPVGGAQLASFALIWLALIVYSGEGRWRARRAAAVP